MASETDICNSALIKVGARRITSLGDGSKEGKICTEMYPRKRDELLRSHPWNFSMKRVELAQTINTPAFDYEQEYQLPSDVLRVFKTDFEEQTNERWVVEGDKLLSNTSTVKILYQARVTDTTKFDAAFVEILSLYMAADFAYALSQSASLAKSLLDQFNVALRDARSIDAQEGFDNNIVEAFTWINERF